MTSGNWLLVTWINLMISLLWRICKLILIIVVRTMLMNHVLCFQVFLYGAVVQICFHYYYFFNFWHLSLYPFWVVCICIFISQCSANWYFCYQVLWSIRVVVFFLMFSSLYFLMSKLMTPLVRNLLLSLWNLVYMYQVYMSYIYFVKSYQFLELLSNLWKPIQVSFM